MTSGKHLSLSWTDYAIPQSSSGLSNDTQDFNYLVKRGRKSKL